MNIERIWEKWADSDKFSGVFSVSGENGVLFEKCCGFRNRSERLTNNKDIAFSIASGTKIITVFHPLTHKDDFLVFKKYACFYKSFFQVCVNELLRTYGFCGA